MLRDYVAADYYRLTALLLKGKRPAAEATSLSQNMLASMNVPNVSYVRTPQNPSWANFAFFIGLANTTVTDLIPTSVVIWLAD